MLKKAVSTILTVLLAAVILLAGCAGPTAETTQTDAPQQAAPAATDAATTNPPSDEPAAVSADDNREVVASVDLATRAKDRYADNENYNYADALNNLPRDYPVKIVLGFNPLEQGIESTAEIVGFYADADLTDKLGTSHEWNKETGDMVFKPLRPNFYISTAVNISKDEFGYPTEVDQYHLFDRGDGNDWGNLGKVYMAQYLDYETGETLDKPLVTVMNFHGELDAPGIKFSTSDDGLAQFAWKAIPGAKKYLVVRAEKVVGDKVHGIDSSPGFYRDLTVVGETDTAVWSSSDKYGGGTIANSAFQTYRFSVDDALSESRREYYEKEGYTEDDLPVSSNTEIRHFYGVIAISEDGTSMVSNLIAEDDIASLLPHHVSYQKMEEDGEGSYVDNIAAAPAYRWVVMCDGTMQQRVINYDFNRAKAVTERWGFYEKEDMSDLVIKDVEIVKIPYTIDGTPFDGIVVVESYDPDTLDADLDALKARQDGLRSKTGTVEVEVQRTTQESADAPTEEVSVAADYNVTANSALSEYLAYNMLGGVENVDISMFKEAGDPDFLVDAFLEATYQNPLALGVENATISNDGSTMHILYQDDPDTMLAKQREIQAEVDRVVAAVTDDDMTDLEKEMALNGYLCETAEYDTAALENAVKNNFEYVDPSFNDSFTPYGVLIKKVGVCASYAGAFKLLADAAGLECIVVTGNLDGSLSHAWNKVKIDGQWQTLDVTNNDNEMLFNALFNLPDYAAKKTLVEDTRFVLDKFIGNYQGESTDKEYYRITDKYYDLRSVAVPLAEQLEEDGTAVLRTDYNLDDELFKEIERQVAEITGLESIGGFYWMGVIYFTAQGS